MAGLVGGTRLLSRENLSERAERLISLMQGSAARMSELIENVMDFTKTRLGGGIVLGRNANEPLGPTIQQLIEAEVDVSGSRHRCRAIHRGTG